MFGDQDLKRLVDVCGHALEAEDRFIAGCVATNREMYKDDLPLGILRFNNERYYQFVCLRGMMSGMPYAADVERGTYDIVLYEPGTGDSRSFAAVGEIKRWMGASGEAEIPAIQEDMEKLRRGTCPGFQVIITASRRGKTEENLQWLAQRLELRREDITSYTFHTRWDTGRWEDPISEVCVAAYFVSRGTPA